MCVGFVRSNSSSSSKAARVAAPKATAAAAQAQAGAEVYMIEMINKSDNDSTIYDCVDSQCPAVCQSAHIYPPRWPSG